MRISKSLVRPRWLLAFLWLAACSYTELGISLPTFQTPPARADFVLNWQPLDSINVNLPPGIRVFQARDPQVPLRAWYVRVDEPNPHLITRVVYSHEPDGKETPSHLARDLGALVLVNAGYFRMDLNPSLHVGLLYRDGHTIHPATFRVLRRFKHYPVVRGAIGFTYRDQVDIAWVSSHGDSVFAWPAPWPNRPGHPAKPVGRGHYWPVRDAVSAGPVLIQNGQVAISSEEEVFFGTKIPQVNPRTAVGYTRKGELILLVVDGRQPESRGVSLEELADILLRLNCVEALNLDGGGSSTLVVQGRRLNRPAGRNHEREIVSALAVFYQP